MSDIKGTFGGLTPAEFAKLQTIPKRDRDNFLQRINKPHLCSDPKKRPKKKGY